MKPSLISGAILVFFPGKNGLIEDLNDELFEKFVRSPLDRFHRRSAPLEEQVPFGVVVVVVVDKKTVSNSSSNRKNQGWGRWLEGRRR